MDIVNHAAAGAATGLYFGSPVIGAIVAVIPDIILIGERRKNPPKVYTFFHSLLFLFICSFIAFLFGFGEVVFFALLSHLILDIPTHGKQWSPQLLWPISKCRFSKFQEWEFGNSSWYYGLLINLAWSTTWVLFS